MTVNTPTWFDWMKLAVDGLTPLTVVLLGLVAARYADRLERRRELSQVTVNWRIKVFHSFAPKLNLLRCFFTYCGNWKQITLEQAADAKRDCDQLIYMNSFLFAPETIKAWRSFVNAAFIENRGPGKEFAFRANIKRHRECNFAWQDDWLDRFVPHEERIPRAAFLAEHDRVLSLVVRDIGVGHSL